MFGRTIRQNLQVFQNFVANELQLPKCSCPEDALVEDSHETTCSYTRHGFFVIFTGHKCVWQRETVRLKKGAGTLCAPYA